MIFKKDPDVTYTQMCIYIDDHIYSGDYDEQKVYEYLYHLFYILAVKRRFFTCQTDYDDFSLNSATAVMLRLVNKRQFLPEDNPNYMPKIKSVLNYIKKVLYPWKVTFQRNGYQQVFNSELDFHNETVVTLRDAFAKHINSSNAKVIQCEFEYYFRKLIGTINYYLKSSPYINDKPTMKNIYVSCLLTMLSAVTLSKKNKHRVELHDAAGGVSDELINDVFDEERQDSITLFHLDKSMTNYIWVTVNRLYSLIGDDLKQIIDSHEVPDNIIRSILTSPVNELLPSED